jgi:hypothetical protein
MLIVGAHELERRDFLKETLEGFRLLRKALRDQGKAGDLSNCPHIFRGHRQDSVEAPDFGVLISGPKQFS